jgi:hypothetical protein
MKRPNVNLVTLLLIGALSYQIAMPAFADDGNSTGGGANSFGGKFFDSVLAKSHFYPKKDPNFETMVKPTLEYVREKLPFLADDLESMLSKDWYLVDRKIIVNTSKDIVFDADQMAYQDRHAIYIDKNLFDAASPEDRAQMIMHELVQGIRVAKRERHPEEKDEVGGTSVVLLNNALLERKAKSAMDLQDLAVKYLKTAYATKEQVAAGIGSAEAFSKEYLEWHGALNENHADAKESCDKNSTPDSNSADEGKKLESGLDYFGQKKKDAPSILNVPRNDKALKADMEARVRAKLFAHAQPGFFADDLRAADAKEICSRLAPLAEKRNAILKSEKESLEQSRVVDFKRVRTADSTDNITTRLYLGTIDAGPLNRLFSSEAANMARNRAMISASDALQKEGDLCLRNLKTELEALKQNTEIRAACATLPGDCELAVTVRSSEMHMPHIYYATWDSRHPGDGPITKEAGPNFKGSLIEMLGAGKCEINTKDYIEFLKATVAEIAPKQKAEIESVTLSSCIENVKAVQEEIKAISQKTVSFVPVNWLSAMEKKIMTSAGEQKKFQTTAECNAALAELRESSSHMKQVADDFRIGKRNGPASAEEDSANGALGIEKSAK